MFKSASLLESEDFSVASFLNNALEIEISAADAADVPSSKNYEEQLQRRMAELALQLQVQTQSCHDDIGRVAAELRAVFPRCATDISRIGIGLQGLQEDSTELLQAHVRANVPHHHPLALEPPNSNSYDPLEILETLSTLQALETNLLQTKVILEAAASYDTILTSIPPLIAASNLSEAVAAWSKLKEGVDALRSLPGHDNREEAVHKIRGDILALLKPQLLHALQRLETRLGPLQKCVSLYHSLGTIDSLVQDYVKSRPTNVHRLWFEFVSGSSKSETTPFVEWLPTWYDAVAALISEERSRAMTVFGYDLAPEVLVRILQECFRPILTSLKTRLSQCYPSDADEVQSHTDTMGSLETITTAYQTTVRFLSEIYELLIPLDKKPTILTRTQSEDKSNNSIVLPTGRMNPKSLLDFIHTTWILVASPFVPYQLNFAPLDMHHSSRRSQQATQELASIVGRKLSLEGLRKVADQIRDMTPAVFPLAQATLTRFELLNCGYWAPNALSNVDSLLSRHLKEMASSIRALSQSIKIADGDTVACLNDEISIQCALSILKNTGLLKGDFDLFKSQVSEQMRTLASRMLSAKEHHVTNDHRMPEEMTSQTIQLFLAKTACANSEEDDSIGSNILYSLADKEADLLFPELSGAIKSLLQTCQFFVCDVCSALPQYNLRTLSTLPLWSRNMREDSFTSNDDESYGALPQSLITQIGEHLLSLVQILEPFASDPNALLLANLAMENIADIPVPSWTELLVSIGVEKELQSIIMKDVVSGEALLDLVLTHPGSHHDNETDDEEPEPDASSTIFCNRWLDVISSTVTATLLKQTIKISKLGRLGCDQLVADYGYLMNVLSALGLSSHPHPLLGHVAQLLEMNDDSLNATIDKGKLVNRDSSLAADILHRINVRLALLRGISS